MRYDLLPLLRCPSGCDTQLSLDSARAGEEVLSGALLCPGCGRTYPIEEGIPRLLPVELSSAPEPPASKATAETGASCPVPHASCLPGEDISAKLSEMRARDEQVGDYDRMWHLNLFSLVEVPATLLHLSLAPRHTLLEAGCGTGRMTREFARRCERMVAADFSWESLRVNAAKLRREGVTNVDLVQADICALPLATQGFDRVVSCQVLEHIPTPACREAAVTELARVLKPGGRLALSAYQYSLLTRCFGEKEGEHAGGIYFYRFAREELAHLLSSHLRVESITGALVYHYLARCAKA